MVGRTRLNFSDALVKSRLEARGFRVTVKDDDEVLASDADQKDIVLLSESAYSRRVGDIFAQVPVPVICWEPYLFDDLGMTGSAAGIDFGYVRKQQELDVVLPEHPLAGKMEGTLPVTDYPARFGWGLPDTTAQVVATLVDDPEKAAVFYYEAETDMPGGFPAPARRIGLFFDKYTPKKLNTDGRRLLEAAFDTALGVNSLKILSDSSWMSTDIEIDDWATVAADDTNTGDWRSAVSPYPNPKPADHWFRIAGTNAEYMWDFPPEDTREMTGKTGPANTWYQKKIDLPVAASALTGDTVTMAVDDVFDFYVNGEPVYSNWDNAGHSGPVTLNILDYLKDGSNLLAIYASDAYRGYEWVLFEATIEWVPVDDPDPVWTMMVYLNGDNQNGAVMVEDLQEMEYGLFEAMKTDPDVIHKLKLFVQYDGPGSNNTIRYLVQPDSEKTGNIVSEVIYNEPEEPNMGDPATLKKFITDTKEAYPDTFHALVLTNHGNAVASRPVAGYTSSPAKYILWDETPGGPYNPDRLYVGEVTNPLDDPVNRLTESESVDVIGLDTGFMGTVEAAYQFRPESGRFGADYMVASPGKPLPSGWNYTEILKSLGDVAELQPADFAATIVEKAYLPGPSAPKYALSAYSLDAVADVKAKLDALAGALALRENANAWNYAKSVRGYASNGSRPLYNGVLIFEYFDDTRLMPNPGYPATRYLTPPSNWLQTPLFDLYGFSEKMSVRTPYTISVVSLAESLKNAVDVCVLASTGRVTRRYFNNRAWPPYMLSNGRHGLAFFVPFFALTGPHLFDNSTKLVEKLFSLRTAAPGNHDRVISCACPPTHRGSCIE